MTFEKYCEELRQQSIEEMNEPIVMVIQNGVASSSKISKEALSTVIDKRSMLGMEVEMLIHKTKIHGGED